MKTLLKVFALFLVVVVISFVVFEVVGFFNMGRILNEENLSIFMDLRVNFRNTMDIILNI